MGASGTLPAASEVASAPAESSSQSAASFQAAWRVGDWWTVESRSVDHVSSHEGWLPPVDSRFTVVAEVAISDSPCWAVEKWPLQRDDDFPQQHTVYYFSKQDGTLLRQVDHFYLLGELQPPRVTDYHDSAAAPHVGEDTVPAFPSLDGDKDGTPVAGRFTQSLQGLRSVRQVGARVAARDSEAASALEKLPAQQMHEVLVAQAPSEERPTEDVASTVQYWSPKLPWLAYEEQHVGQTLVGRRVLTASGHEEPSEKSRSGLPLDLSPLGGEAAAARTTRDDTSASVGTLSNDVGVSGLTGSKVERYFKIAVPSGQGSLTIRTSGGSGDCDLHVKRGAKPTTAIYDYRPWVRGNNETVSVNAPAAGDWYVMLRGDPGYQNVTLRATYLGGVIKESKAATQPWAGWYWPRYDGTNPNNYDATGTHQPMRRYDDEVRPGTSLARDWERINHGSAQADWTGHCHAWAAASFLEPKPSTDQGRFGKGDLEGLLVECYDQTSSSMWPANVNAMDNVPMSPGDFWLALRQNIGHSTPRPLVMDLWTGVQDLSGKDPVWNHPVYQYELTATPLTPTQYSCDAKIWYKNDTSSSPGESGYLTRDTLTVSLKFTVTVKNGVPVAGSGTWQSSSMKSSSKSGYPDFAWYPNQRLRPQNPYVDYATVKTLISGGPVYALQNSTPINALYGAAGSQGHFAITVPSGRSSLKVTLSGGSGDCDLYVKRGQKAGTSTYDSKSAGPATAETVTISKPAAGTWYVLVHGYKSYSGVTLKATY